MSSREEYLSYFKKLKNADEETHQRLVHMNENQILPLPTLVCRGKCLPRGKFRLPSKEVRKRAKKAKPLDISYKDLYERKKNEKKKRPQSVKHALNSYSDEQVTPQTLHALADWLCGGVCFIYIENLALYVYDNGYYRLFTYSFAARFLTDYFQKSGIDYALRSSDYKELVRLIQMQPEILVQPEDCKTNTDIILFSDGAFNVRSLSMRKPKMVDFQFSKIDFPLNWHLPEQPDMKARGFISRFCDGSPDIENYLWELIGYLLSSYQEKILVVFLGPSNSGKSTLANMIRRICGSSSCVALGIKDLSGNFSLAELQGKRLCIDSDMDASALTSKDISLLKKVAGNDLIQGNRKYEQQFYFQCQTKFLICTNNKIWLHSDEDTVSFFNRIKIFELKESIPAESQCHNMEQILDNNRTYFLQEAMKGLNRLVHNNFSFSCNIPAENFVENINHKDEASISDFILNCCEFGELYRETAADLYNEYIQFSAYNDQPAANMKKFSCFIANNYNVDRARTSSTRFFKGIRLLTDDK